MRGCPTAGLQPACRVAFPLLCAGGDKATKGTKDTKRLPGMRPNEVSYKVIGAAMKVHTA